MAKKNLATKLTMENLAVVLKGHLRLCRRFAH